MQKNGVIMNKKNIESGWVYESKWYSYEETM